MNDISKTAVLFCEIWQQSDKTSSHGDHRKRPLHEQYAQKITLDTLSARYNISKYHLQRSFQRYFGQSPGEYLTRLRLTRAKALLRATDLPVSEVAYRVGMENTSYFISVFRSREGATPSKYRKSWSTFDAAGASPVLKSESSQRAVDMTAQV